MRIVIEFCIFVSSFRVFDVYCDRILFLCVISVCLWYVWWSNFVSSCHQFKSVMCIVIELCIFMSSVRVCDANCDRIWYFRLISSYLCYVLWSRFVSSCHHFVSVICTAFEYFVSLYHQFVSVMCIMIDFGIFVSSVRVFDVYSDRVLYLRVISSCLWCVLWSSFVFPCHQCVSWWRFFIVELFTCLLVVATINMETPVSSGMQKKIQKKSYSTLLYTLLSL